MSLGTGDNSLLGAAEEISVLLGTGDNCLLGAAEGISVENKVGKFDGATAGILVG